MNIRSNSQPQVAISDNLSRHGVLSSKLPTGKKTGDSDLTPTQFADLPVMEPALTGTGFRSKQSIHGLHCGSDIELAQGEVLAKRYEILRRIGDGGMGVVYAARDQLREEEVALKVMREHLIRDPLARERFVNEARVASSISHPGIVRVYDIHQTSKITFLTMELLNGCTLRDEIQNRLERQQRFSVEEVKQFGLQLCQALTHAHQSTIHRDIKPENIWICEDGTLKLMDFGIARMMRPSQFASTGLSMGTAYYMAPEQLKAQKDIDHRADQYSTGVVLYELLTGQLPQGAVQSPVEIRRNVPSMMSKAVMTCLAGNPKDRHSDMPALEAILEKDKSAKSRKSMRIMALLVLALICASSPWWFPPAKYEALKFAAGNLLQEVKIARQEAMDKHDGLLQLQAKLAGVDYPVPQCIDAGNAQFEAGDALLQSQLYQSALEKFTSTKTQFETALQQIDQWTKDEFKRRSTEAKQAIDLVRENEQRAQGIIDSAEQTLAQQQSGDSIPAIEAAKLALKDLTGLKDFLANNRNARIQSFENALIECDRSSTSSPGERLKKYDEVAENARVYADSINKTVETSKSHSESRFAKAKNEFEQAARFAKAGKNDQAIEAYSRSIQLDPKNAAAYFKRGTTFQKLNNPERSIEDLGKAIELEPAHADAFYARAAANETLRRYEQAIDDYSKAISYGTSAGDAYFRRGSANQKTGMYESAIADYTKAIKSNAKDKNAYYNRGVVNNDLGRFEQAIADYSKVIDLDPKARDAFHKRGFINIELGHDSKAIADLSKAIEFGITNAEIYMTRGSAYQRTSSHDRAIADFGKVISLDSKSAEAFYKRGISNNQRGRYEQSIADFGKAIGFGIKTEDSYFERGSAYLKTKNFVRAVADFSKVLEFNSKNVDAHYYRGYSNYELKRFELAARDFGKAIDQGCDAKYIYFKCGYANQAIGNDELAIKDYTKSIKRSRTDYTAYYNRGISYGRLEKHRQAIADYSKAIELNPSYASAYNNRGNAYKNLNDLPKRNRGLFQGNRNKTGICKGIQQSCVGKYST